MGLDFSVVPSFMNFLLLGAVWTIAITAAATVLSFLGGVLFAVIALYAPTVVRLPFRLFEWLFMGTPLLLQLFLIYFGLVRDVIPPIGNNMIALLKDSALVSVIGVSEITLSAQLAIGRTYRAFEFYAAAAVLYYIINLGMEAVLRRIERRMQLSR